MQPASWIAASEARYDAAVAAASARVSALLPAAARVLVGEFGAKEVVVFGSFGPAGCPGMHSDVDFLVTNVDAVSALRATAVLSRLLGRDVDIICSERCRPEVWVIARQTGRILYGA